MDYKDLMLDMSYEGVSLAFDILSVVTFDEDSFNFWLLFLFFLIYPICCSLYQQMCSCCCDCLVLMTELWLTMTKVLVYSFFSSWSGLSLFIVLGCASVAFAVAKHFKSAASKEPEPENAVQQAAQQGLGVLNFFAGCCCGNLFGIAQSILLLVFTFFPEESRFRTNTFDIVATILLWSMGYTWAHLGDIIMLKLTAHFGKEVEGEGGEGAGAALCKYRIMSSIRYLGYAASVYIYYLCGMYISDGEGETWEIVFCVVYLVIGFGTIIQAAFDICCAMKPDSMTEDPANVELNRLANAS